jgi:hypothetical protein
MSFALLARFRAKFNELNQPLKSPCRNVASTNIEESVAKRAMTSSR